MKILALVPARSGSKSIPNKNLQEISGVPLLGITIRSAQKSSSVTEIYVSSDSNEILARGLEFGSKSVKRPLNLSSDTATANDVVRHFINHLNLSFEPETIIVYLQPTSPFRKSGMIEEGIKKSLQESKPVVAVSEVRQHPHKMLEVVRNGCLEHLLRNSDPTSNRQQLPKILIPTGSLYVFSVASFCANNVIPIRGALPLPVTGVYALDIDTEIDLEIARMIGIRNEL